MQLMITGDLVTIRRLVPKCSIWLVTFGFAIMGCESTQHHVPVVDRTLTNSQVPLRSDGGLVNDHEQLYIVQRGDTLYSVALDHGITLGELAEWNNIADPSSIKPGQRISLSVPSKISQRPMLIALPDQSFPGHDEAVGNEVYHSSEEVKRTQIMLEPKGHILPYSDQAVVRLQGLAHPALITSSSLENRDIASTIHGSARIENAPEPENKAFFSDAAGFNDANTDWIWPANGKLLEKFSTKSKGVIIAGVVGQPVFASAAGKVVYSGNGLRGYGKLLIIKHDNTYLSAYAHNSKILVQEGDAVTKGQKIAEMGDSDTDSVKLHFEIRKNGKPVNPLQFFPGRSSG